MVGTHPTHWHDSTERRRNLGETNLGFRRSSLQERQIDLNMVTHSGFRCCLILITRASSTACTALSRGQCLRGPRYVPPFDWLGQRKRQNITSIPPPRRILVWPALHPLTSHCCWHRWLTRTRKMSWVAALVHSNMPCLGVQRGGRFDQKPQMMTLGSGQNDSNPHIIGVLQKSCFSRRAHITVHFVDGRRVELQAFGCVPITCHSNLWRVGEMLP